MSQLSKHQISH